MAFGRPIKRFGLAVRHLLLRSARIVRIAGWRFGRPGVWRPTLPAAVRATVLRPRLVAVVLGQPLPNPLVELFAIQRTDLS